MGISNGGGSISEVEEAIEMMVVGAVRFTAPFIPDGVLGAVGEVDSEVAGFKLPIVGKDSMGEIISSSDAAAEGAVMTGNG